MCRGSYGIAKAGDLAAGIMPHLALRAPWQAYLNRQAAAGGDPAGTPTGRLLLQQGLKPTLKTANSTTSLRSGRSANRLSWADTPHSVAASSAAPEVNLEQQAEILEPIEGLEGVSPSDAAYGNRGTYGHATLEGLPMTERDRMSMSVIQQINELETKAVSDPSYAIVAECLQRTLNHGPSLAPQGF